MSTRRMMVASEPKGIVKDGIIQDSWKTIVNVCQSGEADKYYTVGDKAPIAFGENPFNMVYAGSGLDTRSDGSGNPVTTWISDRIIFWSPISYMSLAEDWPASFARNLCNNLLAIMFENIIGSSLIEIKKLTTQQNGTDETVDKVFIPQYSELTGIYRPVFPSLIRTFNGNNSRWWVRDTDYYKNHRNIYIDSNGAKGTTYSHNQGMGILPCFCL